VLFEQVLINVLDNASKYSPAGSPIAIRGVIEDRQLRIEISDEGPGLGKARPNGNGNADGKGIGLTLCNAIMKAHGGRIDAANGAERGAVFTLRIPATT
jgi:two-component system sensor histidine kinase KdpD